MATIQYDVWAINPDSDDEHFFSSATITSSGAVSLSTNDVGYNGAGYKVSITSDGADSATLFTITGVKVGAVIDDGVVTETINGPSASVVFSENYYTRVNSVSTNAASDGAVKIGFGGKLAFPRTRIKALTYVNAATAGSILFTAEPSGREILKVFTPANATNSDSLVLPGEGVLTTKNQNGDFAVLTLESVEKVTVVCG